MTEEQLQELLRSAASQAGEGPEPPLERIWERVEARVFESPALTLSPRRQWWPRPVAQAAILLVGLGIGFVVGRGSGGASGESLSDQPEVLSLIPAQTPFVGVATNYLEQATALLIDVAGDLPGPDAIPPQTLVRAQQLLSTTRLLLDTAPSDPSLLSLLEDLELVLAQVARLPNTRTGPEQALIRQTLDQHDVLPRLTVYLADARSAP